MAHMILTLCTIGSTGVGKSSLCNLLAGSPGPTACDSPGEFGVSSGIDACTQRTVTRTHRWLADGEPIKLIDTPGLGDPGGRDSQNIAQMVRHLKEEQHVNTFLLVLNSQVPRLDEYMRANLAIFRDVFGADFFKHMILVFTRWGYDSRSVTDRDRSGITKEKKQMELNTFLKETYDIAHTIPAVFLDNFPDFDDPTEKEMTLKELRVLKDLASAMPPFSCLDAQARKGHVDQLEEQKETERKRREAAEAEAKEQGEKADQERKRREDEKKLLEEELERQKIEQEKEWWEKEEQRRRETKAIWADKIRLRQINRVRDWTLVPCPGGDVPTWRPDLILCGPANMVTVEEGGNLNPRPPDWTPVLAAEALTLVAPKGGWEFEDFSELEIKLDFEGTPIHINFKKD